MLLYQRGTRAVPGKPFFLLLIVNGAAASCYCFQRMPELARCECRKDRAVRVPKGSRGASAERIARCECRKDRAVRVPMGSRGARADGIARGASRRQSFGSTLGAESRRSSTALPHIRSIASGLLSRIAATNYAKIQGVICLRFSSYERISSAWLRVQPILSSPLSSASLRNESISKRITRPLGVVTV